jgi:hypothetical protein
MKRCGSGWLRKKSRVIIASAYIPDKKTESLPCDSSRLGNRSLDTLPRRIHKVITDSVSNWREIVVERKRWRCIRRSQGRREQPHDRTGRRSRVSEEAR